MSDGTYRGWWIDQVFRAPSISDAVRVALLALAMGMDDAGIAEVPREDLAAKLSRSDRRIGERISSAIDAGFLIRLSRGQRNGKTRYQAMVPDHLSSGHPGVPKKPDLNRTPGGPEENSLQDGLQPEENPAQQDTRGSRREPFDPSVFRTPGGPEEAAPLNKDHARAHSRDHLSPQAPQPSDVDQTPGGTVVALFGEQIPTGKTNTSAKRAKPEPQPPVTREDFDKFWATYPRRIAKGAARKAWDKALKNGADPEEIIWGARAYATSPRRTAADIQYTAYPATWLNGERWTDEADPAPAPSTTTSRVAQVDDALAEFRRLTGADEHPNTIRGEVLR